MSTMDRALAAIANGEAMTTDQMLARTASPAPGDVSRGTNIGTEPRRERLVSLG